MREIKFRCWSKASKTMQTWEEMNQHGDFYRLLSNKKYPIMQFTGLTDKNGVEIYEFMEIDDTFEVSFIDGSYVLTNISNGDIIVLSNYIKDKNGQITITKEYTKI